MKRASSTLSELASELGLGGRLGLHRLKASWEKIFGDTLGSRMYPVSFSRSELLVEVDSPIWLQELSFLKAEILMKLKPYGVEGIRFRAGSARKRQAAGRGRPEEPAAKGLTPSEEAFIEELGASVEDSELRESIRAAARKSLSSPKARRSHFA